MLAKYLNRNDVPDNRGPLYYISEEEITILQKNFILALLSMENETIHDIRIILALLDIEVPLSLAKEVIDEFTDFPESEKQTLLDTLKELDEVTE
jgi:hypothetical protein